MRGFFEKVASGDPDSVFLLVALYFVAMAGISLVVCFRMSRWDSVIGDLTDNSIGLWHADNAPGERMHMAEAKYHYLVDGKRYEGTRVSPFYLQASENFRGVLEFQRKGIETLADNRVRVHYNPKRPEKSFLILPGVIGYSFVVSIGVVPVAAYLFA